MFACYEIQDRVRDRSRGKLENSQQTENNRQSNVATRFQLDPGDSDLKEVQTHDRRRKDQKQIDAGDEQDGFYRRNLFLSRLLRYRSFILSDLTPTDGSSVGRSHWSVGQTFYLDDGEDRHTRTRNDVDDESDDRQVFEVHRRTTKACDDEPASAVEERDRRHHDGKHPDGDDGDADSSLREATDVVDRVAQEVAAFVRVETNDMNKGEDAYHARIVKRLAGTVAWIRVLDAEDAKSKRLERHRNNDAVDTVEGDDDVLRFAGRPTFDDDDED